MKIIAEIAQGYEGNPKLAQLLTKAAINSGADIVKFQIIYADELATPDYKAYDLFKSLEMDDSVWEELVNEIHKNDKEVYFDIYGNNSFELAKKLKADGIKISTTEFYNEHLIKLSLESFSNLLISTGGIPIEDLHWLVDNIIKTQHNKVCFLHGFQSEPTPLDQNNLAKIPALMNVFPQFNWGFMDHSDGATEDAYFLPIMAMSHNIKYIEKHLTLDRLLKIEDYISALEASKFEKFVHLVRKFEQAVGSNSLEVSDLEKAYKNRAGKVVVAIKDIEAGKKIEFEDIALKRTPISTEIKGFNKINDVLTKSLNRSIKKDEMLTSEMLSIDI